MIACLPDISDNGPAEHLTVSLAVDECAAMTPAHELDDTQWFNAAAPQPLRELRGRVVVLHAFQMLCPGCVQGGIPQGQHIANFFSPVKVVVIGLHTGFEQDAAMT